MEVISSVKNDRVKAAAKLVGSSKARRETGLFVLEGLRLCMDVVRSDLRCAELFVSEEFCEKHGDAYETLAAVSDDVLIVSDAVLSKLSDTETPQGVCCVVKMPAPANVLSGAGEEAKVLFLENVQDPANLGAMARTAEALGVSGLAVCGGCDVYSSKALRASMGALLRLPVETGKAAELLARAKAAGFTCYASTPDAEATRVSDVDWNGRALCVVGNEANGVTAETMEACDACVTIPMAGRAESLNAAAAGAILMWEMTK